MCLCSTAISCSILFFITYIILLVLLSNKLTTIFTKSDCAAKSRAVTTLLYICSFMALNFFDV